MPGELLLTRLRKLRRRLIAQALVERLARGMMVALVAGLILSLVERWWGNAIRWESYALIAALLVCAWAGTVTALRRPSLERMAALLDRLGDTRDRWTSLLAFLKAPASPQRQAAIAECTGYLESRDFRPHLPWRVPRALTWAIAPLAAIVLVQWQIRDLRLAAEQEAALAREEIAPRVQQVETLARAIEQAKAEIPSDELEKLAEQLRQSLEQMRSAAVDRPTAAKAAMRELSRLEQMIREMQQAATPLSQDELEALAKALESHPETEAAADALKEGHTADAARALEAAARKLSESKDTTATQQAEETLRRAMERLAQQRQISQALRDLAQQLSQRTGQGAAGQMLQQLARMLRESRMALGTPSQKPGARDDKDAQQILQKTLAALQNMKHGEAPGKIPEAGRENDNDGSVLMQSFGDPAGSNNGFAPMIAATGNPGSERDSGTSDNPLGSERSEIADKGGEMRLRGQLGEGETLSQMLPAAGGDDKARQRYKEIYEAMAAAAEDAVLQEDIPLGSRFLIKRYFESIRPD